MFTHAPSPVGPLLVLFSGDGTPTGIHFPSSAKAPAESAWGEAVELSAAMKKFPQVAALVTQLEEYFAGSRREFDVELGWDGVNGEPGGTGGASEFNLRVWKLLQEIPYGATVAYGELAEKLGSKGLAQRVGQAVGSNPFSIVVPCHRVVGADGSLTGFAGGLERKRFLLALEEPAAGDAGRLF
ncbi:MAG TPA: methylated-DNA--[protein]-cysteine S-methyltransferase [Candidatus Corynebacterium gallistercoris]|uniref:methylated-DNA--[protein]-cysteine S-methyltransferase n=1 Tax=Candidatus Corynebacterium gallistercoris TaxID=2838530 RepID=A0A9D1RYE3_9CORY|nr:methylated-DNA--[protein]-cysteine S-methyltransferase [Candidatus Corynebacterium gallistercoris]